MDFQTLRQSLTPEQVQAIDAAVDDIRRHERDERTRALRQQEANYNQRLTEVQRENTVGRNELRRRMQQETERQHTQLANQIASLQVAQQQAEQNNVSQAQGGTATVTGGQRGPQRPENGAGAPQPSEGGSGGPATPTTGTSGPTGHLPTSEWNPSLYGLDLTRYNNDITKSSNITLPKLEDTNFKEWSMAMKIFLRQKCLWGIVDGNLPRPDDLQRAVVWQRYADYIVGVFWSCASDSQKANVSVEADVTPYELYRAWDEIHGVHAESRTGTLLAKLTNMKAKKGDRVDTIVAYMRRMNEELGRIDKQFKQNDKLMCHFIINAFQDVPQFKNEVYHLRKVENPTVERVIQRLKLEEENVKDSKDANSKESARVGEESKKGNNKPRKNIECYRCHKTGHIAKDCDEKSESEAEDEEEKSDKKKGKKKSSKEYPKESKKGKDKEKRLRRKRHLIPRREKESNKLLSQMTVMMRKDPPQKRARMLPSLYQPKVRISAIERGTKNVPAQRHGQ